MNKTEKTTFTVPSSAELEQLAELHKAMGDYTRIRIRSSGSSPVVGSSTIKMRGLCSNA